MDTKIDDLTGLQINATESWKIKVVQPNKATMEIDAAYSDYIKNLVTLATKNGQRWFKWKKTVVNGRDKLEKDFQYNQEGVQDVL